MRRTSSASPSSCPRNCANSGKSLGATPFVVLLAIFKTLLYRYTGQEDLTVGTTTSGRTGGSFTRVVGYFVNTLAIRTGLSPVRHVRHVSGAGETADTRSDRAPGLPVSAAWSTG